MLEQKKKTIELKLIEQHAAKSLGPDAYWQAGGYPLLAAIIRNLADEGIITPVKARGMNGKNPSLYYFYRVLPKAEKPEQSKIKQLLTYYHPMINTSFYLKHSREFRQDERYLALLDGFLKANPDRSKTVPITANERSFQVFRDEKWLLSVQGQNFLQRIGLSLEDMCCYVTYEPFFYYAKRNTDQTELKVLIVENKDTFFSLKNLFHEGINTWDGITFSVLIYGEGRKIERSISFFDEIDEYRDIPAEFYYFGDLDPEGISIWHALAGRWSVKPFGLFYRALVAKYGQDAPVIKRNQRFSPDAVEAFATHFPADFTRTIKKLLANGCYLPQEGLDYASMRELAQNRQY